MKNKSWPFSDPCNVAAIADRNIVFGGAMIVFVSHDFDDGMWQFHVDRPESLAVADAAVVSLEDVVGIDPTICELADLPLGWCATREIQGGPWKRLRME